MLISLLTLGQSPRLTTTRSLRGTPVLRCFQIPVLYKTIINTCYYWENIGVFACEYRVDEVEAAISVQFINNGQEVWCGFKGALRSFDTNRPGRQKETVSLKTDFPNVTGLVSCIRENPAMSGLLAFGTYSKCIGGTDGFVSVWRPGEGTSVEEDHMVLSSNIKLSNDCVNGVSMHKCLPILATSSGQRLCDDEINNRDNGVRLWSFQT